MESNRFLLPILQKYKVAGLMAGESIIFGLILWGFLLGKIIPVKIQAWRKWWYNRRGIMYFIVYMITAGKVTDKLLIKQDQLQFTHNKGEFLTFKKDPITGNSFTPGLEWDGEKVVFYNTNNTNPIEFQETRAVETVNDPIIFKTIIEDESIRQALSPEFDISELKRFILMAMIVVAGVISLILWLLFR